MDLPSVTQKLRSLGFTGGKLGKEDFDSARSLAAYSLIDKNGNVVLDADNLAATLANLIVLTPPTSRAKIADLLLSDPVAVDTEAKAATLMAGVSNPPAPDPKWESSSLLPWKPENLEDTVSKLSGPGFSNLRSRLDGQFGIRLQSTGAGANVGLTRIIFQTVGVSPSNPCLVNFEQIIDDPFTGDGQFDLVERDAKRRVYDGASAGGTPILTSATMNFRPSDVDNFIKIGLNPGRYYSIVSRQSASQVTLSPNITLPSSGLTLTMDGSDESEVTIATKDGFENGDTTSTGSRFRKILTTDKTYSVVFAPGDAGVGAYSINVRGLNGGK